MTKASDLTRALRGLRSIKLTAAQEFRISEQRSNYDALTKNRARRAQ